jgi:hypothetical protein
MTLSIRCLHHRPACSPTVATKAEVRVDSLLTESTGPQTADKMIPFHPIMTHGKGASLVTVLANDGLLRSNIDPSASSLPALS